MGKNIPQGYSSPIKVTAGSLKIETPLELTDPEKGAPHCLVIAPGKYPIDLYAGITESGKDLLALNCDVEAMKANWHDGQFHIGNSMDSIRIDVSALTPENEKQCELMWMVDWITRSKEGGYEVDDTDPDFQKIVQLYTGKKAMDELLELTGNDYYRLGNARMMDIERLSRLVYDNEDPVRIFRMEEAAKFSTGMHLEQLRQASPDIYHELDQAHRSIGSDQARKELSQLLERELPEQTTNKKQHTELSMS